MKWVNISGEGANCVKKGIFAEDIKLKEGLWEQWDEWEHGRKIPQLKIRQISWQQRLSLKQELDATHQRLRSVIPVLALSSSRLCHWDGLQKNDKILNCSKNSILCSCFPQLKQEAAPLLTILWKKGPVLGGIKAWWQYCLRNRVGEKVVDRQNEI